MHTLNGRLVSLRLAVLAGIATALPGPSLAVEPAGLEWVAPDAAAFVRILPQELWQAELFKAHRQIARQAEKEFLKLFDRALGIRITDLEQVTVLLPSQDSLRDPFPDDGPEAKGAILIVTMAVGIVHHIQPVARPVLTVAWARQQTIHNFRVSIWCAIVEKRP